MSNEDVVKMLECIENQSFCDESNRTYEYCMETDCTKCQIDFCKQVLKENGMLMFYQNLMIGGKRFARA